MIEAARQRQLPWRNLLGIALLSSYVLWNVGWWAQGQLAPSIFTWATGLPCPTTGGTRSMLALAQGHVLESIALHPFAVPLVLLLAVSIAQGVSRGRLARWVPGAWMWLLGLSWVIQLARGPVA